jgi:hypothetical protein
MRPQGAKHLLPLPNITRFNAAGNSCPSPVKKMIKLFFGHFIPGNYICEVV